VLQPGQTAIVVTAEEFNLPPNIAAFGFPPTRISSNGILMTNPGHVDPGFKGYLSFTVINMSRSDFILRYNDTIVTCLLVQLTDPVCRDYGNRGNPRGSNVPHQETYDRLSPDFLDFEERSRGIAKATARKQIMRWDRQSFVVLVVTLLLGLVTVYLTSIGPIGEIKADVSALKVQQTSRDLRGELEELKLEMQRLRKQLQAEDEEAPGHG
jgi:dCTP deaminase